MAVHRSEGIPISQVRLVSGLVAAVVFLALAVLAAAAMEDPGGSWIFYLGAVSAWALYMLRHRIQRHA